MALERARSLALLAACTNGDGTGVQQLLAEAPAGSLSTCQDEDGWTPLMRAVTAGHVLIVNLLLSSKALGPAQLKVQNKVRRDNGGWVPPRSAAMPSALPHNATRASAHCRACFRTLPRALALQLSRAHLFARSRAARLRCTTRPQSGTTPVSTC